MNRAGTTRRLRPHFTALRLLGIVLLQVLSGCSSMPETRYFMLAPTLTAPAAVDVKIEVGRLPGYLQDSGIALETADVEIHHARYAQWAEPLREGLSRAVRRTVEQTPVSIRGWQQIHLSVLHFHGSAEGLVRLAVDWRATSACLRRQGRYQGTRLQEGDGYAALVQTQSLLVEEMTQAIMRDLAEVDCAADNPSAPA